MKNLKKTENLKKQIRQAEQKYQTINENIQSLENKKVQIDEQIAANRKKLAKLSFHIEKCQKDIEDQRSQRPPELPQ